MYVFYASLIFEEIHCKSNENNREKRLKKMNWNNWNMRCIIIVLGREEKSLINYLTACVFWCVCVCVCPAFGSCTEGKVRYIPNENNKKIIQHIL